MHPGEAALEIDGVGLANGAVGGELDGAALDECACGHDDLAVVAGHIPRHRGDVAVHRRGGLNALAEGAHRGLAAQLHGLNDVVTRLGGIGYAAEAELLVDVRGEDRALERAGDDGGGEEEALIQARHQAQIRTDLLAQTRGGEAVRAAVYARLRAADVAADGRKAAARILDQGADDHVRAEVTRLNDVHKLAVAIVHHADDVAADALDERDQLADLPDGERRTGCIALGALDGAQLRLRLDLRADALVVDAAVREEIDLVVGHAVLGQGARALADADDLLERVVRAADGGEQLVAGAQVGAQRDGQRVRAAQDARAHERGLGVKAVGIDALERVAADVVVAVAGGAGEAAGIDAVLLHGGDDLRLVVLGDLVNLIETSAQGGEHLLAEPVDLFADAELAVHVHIVNHGMFLVLFSIISEIYTGYSIAKRGAPVNSKK